MQFDTLAWKAEVRRAASAKLSLLHKVWEVRVCALFCLLCIYWLLPEPEPVSFISCAGIPNNQSTFGAPWNENEEQTYLTQYVTLMTDNHHLHQSASSPTESKWLLLISVFLQKLAPALSSGNFWSIKEMEDHMQSAIRTLLHTCCFCFGESKSGLSKTSATYHFYENWQDVVQGEASFYYVMSFELLTKSQKAPFTYR